MVKTHVDIQKTGNVRTYTVKVEGESTLIGAYRTATQLLDTLSFGPHDYRKANDSVYNRDNTLIYQYQISIR